MQSCYYLVQVSSGKLTQCRLSVLSLNLCSSMLRASGLRSLACMCSTGLWRNCNKRYSWVFFLTENQNTVRPKLNLHLKWDSSVCVESFEYTFLFLFISSKKMLEVSSLQAILHCPRGESQFSGSGKILLALCVLCLLSESWVVSCAAIYWFPRTATLEQKSVDFLN